MSKRVITRKERLQRAEKRKKMLQSFELCLFLSIIIVVIYLIIYIPMALNYKNIFLNPLGEFFYSNNDFLLFIRNLYLMKAGIITLADISTAFMLSLFFAFMFIGFANLAEYYKRTAGLLEVIIFSTVTILLSIIYAFISASAVIIVFTALGCILTVLYVYVIQS